MKNKIRTVGVKGWLKRHLPAPGAVRANRWISVFGRLLLDPNLWHLNRRSVSGAVAAGLFVMFLPPLGQSLVAAALAILFRVNLPLAVAVSWVSNPFTLPPLLYLAYSVGSWVLGIEPARFSLDFWLDWHNWQALLWPLTIGGLICATAASATGYFLVQWFWRWRLVRQIRIRRERYRAATSRESTPSSRRQT